MSRKIAEFLDGQTSLPDNAPKRAGLEVLSAMDGNRHPTRRIVRPDEQMVAAGNSIDDKSSTLERPNNPSAIDRRQTRVHAAMVTV
jgi:hypothetical protein